MPSCWVSPEASVLLAVSSHSPFALCAPSQVALVAKIRLLVQETQVQSLGQEDPLEWGTAVHSSILAWKNSWIKKPSP